MIQIHVKYCPLFTFWKDQCLSRPILDLLLVISHKYSTIFCSRTNWKPNTMLCYHHNTQLKSQPPLLNVYKSIKKKVGAVLYNGRICGSSRWRQLKASHGLAKHPLTGYRAAQVNYFCIHKVVIKVGTQERTVIQICAAVSWYDLHQEQQWFCKVFCKHFQWFCFSQTSHAD